MSRSKKDSLADAREILETVSFQDVVSFLCKNSIVKNPDDANILLQNLLKNDTLTLTEIETILTMSKKSQVSKVHSQTIGVRPDGRFYTYLYEKGIRRQKTFATEKALYQFLYDFYFGRTRITLEGIFPEFMRYRRDRGKVSDKTIEENKICWNRFLKDTELVKNPLCDITVKDYITFFELLTKDGTYTAKAIGNLKSLLNKIYDYAIREEIVMHNPIHDIDFKEFRYYVPYNDEKVYKDEDRLTLLHHIKDIDDPYALAIRLMFQLTVRIGELKSFKWDDVNYEERTIRICKQALATRRMHDDLSFAPHETIVVDHTKKNTPQGKRKLYLTNEALAILEKEKQLNPDGEYIFMPYGRIMRTETVNDHLKKYCKECGIPYYSSHKIRFTSASALYNGKNLTQVSKALGHSQVATTLHYFRDVTPDEDLRLQMEDAFSVK